MFFWLSLGMFVGLATASAMAYRKEINQQLPEKKTSQLPGKKSSDAFELGDKLVFDTQHFIITQVMQATDGMKNLYVGELDSTQKVLLFLTETHKTWVKALCEPPIESDGEREFTNEFQEDGVRYKFCFETRMKIQQQSEKALHEGATASVRYYESQNHHRFICVIQGDAFTWQLKGETHLEDILMILPKS